MSAAGPPQGENSASSGGSAAAQPQAWGDHTSDPGVSGASPTPAADDGTASGDERVSMTERASAGVAASGDEREPATKRASASVAGSGEERERVTERAPTGVATSGDERGPTSPLRLVSTSLRRDALRGALILVAALLACTLGYLALTLPGAWFPRAEPRAWDAKNLEVARGAARVVGDELIVTAPDANGIALVTVTTDVRATDYPGIAWIVADLREDADVRVLWRTDFQPDKLNSAPLHVESGRTLPAVLAKNPAWIGRITGLALAIHDPLAQPVRVRGVIAKPMGAVGTLRDRFREWFAFEAWNGASINTIVGGADNQPVPLPAVLALVIALGVVATVLIRRFRPGALGIATPVIVAGFFIAGWLVLDARWTFNLLRQEEATATLYGGKDLRDKHLASDDAALFAFIEKVRAVLPQTPARIFIAADADYFRGRAAYHLYPNRVYFSPRSNDLPPATAFHPGDWLLVFHRRGMQFDRSQGKIRWDGNQTVNAELKLLEPGAALFVVR